MELRSNERRAGPVRMACWAYAFVAALVAPHAGADPVITPDPGRNASAVSPLTPDTVSDKRHGLKLDYSIAPVGFRIVLPPPDASEKRAAAATGGKRRTVVGFHRDMPGDFEGDLSPRLDWTRHADASLVSSLTITSPGGDIGEGRHPRGADGGRRDPLLRRSVG